MNISLIVVTLGRKTELRRLLVSLVRQTFKTFEIILVDQNPEGYLDAVLAPFRDKLSIEVIHSAPKGVSAARNLGFGRIKGEIVGFPDDDCWYMPNALERLHGFFSESPAASGIVVAWDKQGRQMKASSRTKAMTPFSAFRKAGTLVQFFRRSTLGEIRFDPAMGPGTVFPYGCGEDTDFLLRVIDNGQVLYVDEVLICHPLPDIRSSLMLQKVHSYALGRMYVLHKHQFPFWFTLVNILYPLYRLVFEGTENWRYRKAMFLGRVVGFWHVRFKPGEGVPGDEFVGQGYREISKRRCKRVDTRDALR